MIIGLSKFWDQAHLTDLCICEKFTLTRTPTHGLASTLRMRTAIPLRQWQPWTAVSTVGQKVGLKALCILPVTAEVWRWRYKGCFAPVSLVKGRMQSAFSPIFCPTAETAVHGCHCLGDMAVRMRKVLARPWVGVRVCHLLLLLFY